MVDPVTANIALAVPIRGSDVGTWDTPVNGDFTIIDGAFGGVTTIALTSAAVTLATSQAQNNIIRLTGTLTASVGITLPSIYKFWTIDNQIVNSPSSFAVVLASTSGANQIGCPPGTQDVFYDGTTIKYKGLGKVGEYWDYAGTTVPTWISLSTKPPYLNCTGTTFSSATYPILSNLFGGNTLPDSRNRMRIAISQGSSRVTSAISGLDGATLFAAGGDQLLQNHTHTVSDPGHAHTAGLFNPVSGGTRFAGANGGFLGLNDTVNTAFTGISINTAGTGGSQNVPPGYVGGITMIRAE